MSLQFSDPSSGNRRGIVELIDDRLGTTASTYSLARKTRDINLALDEALAIIFAAGGTWQFDDANNTDYPIITTNLNANQRDYSFVKDGSGNFILDIYKITIAQPNGTFIDIFPSNQRQVPNNSQSDPVRSFYDGQNTVGTPTRFDLTGNGIFLDAIPNYSVANGLKIYINREGSYFKTTDTTKYPGFVGLFHEYLALRPIYKYAADKGMPIAGGRMKNGSYTGILLELMNMKADIISYYGNRQRFQRRQFQANVENNK